MVEEKSTTIYHDYVKESESIADLSWWGLVDGNDDNDDDDDKLLDEVVEAILSQTPHLVSQGLLQTPTSFGSPTAKSTGHSAQTSSSFSKEEQLETPRNTLLSTKTPTFSENVRNLMHQLDHQLRFTPKEDGPTVPKPCSAQVTPAEGHYRDEGAASLRRNDTTMTSEHAESNAHNVSVLSLTENIVPTDMATTTSSAQPEDDFHPSRKAGQPELVSFVRGQNHQSIYTETALQRSAAEEREATRQWARETRETVEKWVEKQRALVQCDRRSAIKEAESLVETQKAAQDQAVADVVARLRREIDAVSTQHRALERILGDIIQHQATKIAELEGACQGSERHQHLDTTGTPDDDTKCVSPSTRELSPRSHDPPGTIGSFSTEEEMDSVRSRREIQTFRDGRKIVRYRNGAEREYLEDGTRIVRYANGDEAEVSPEGVVAYFHYAEEVSLAPLPLPHLCFCTDAFFVRRQRTYASPTE